MIEEDLFFPGKSPNDDDDESVAESEASSSSTLLRTKLRRQSLPSSAYDNMAQTQTLERTNHERDRDSDSLTGSNSGGSRRSSSIISGRHSDELAWSSTTSGTTVSSAAVPHAPSLHSVTPPRSSSPLPPAATVDSIAEDVEGEKLETISTSAVVSELDSPKSIPKSPSAINLRERIVPVALRSPASPLLSHARPTLRTSAVLPVSRPLQGKFASAAEWMMDSLSSPTYRKSALPTRTQIEVKTSHDAKSASTLVGSQRSPIAPSVGASIISTTKKTPLLLRSLPRPPSNPRDHSLLALIYAEMCESRFINLSPLSLLANLLGLHFHGNVFQRVWTGPTAIL